MSDTTHHDPEVCICAAIRLTDGRIIQGRRRHWDLIKEAYSHNEGYVRQDQQGFVTSRGRFVTREEGRKLQEQAGIASVAPGGYRGDTLFSEDLYR